MAVPLTVSLSTSEAVRIVTGVPVSGGTGRGFLAEWLEVESHGSNPCRIHALAAVPPGQNTRKPGKDIAYGTVLAEHGRVLRPQDMGTLSSGKGEVRAVRLGIKT